MNNCNLTTCRYNADGKCTNEEKRKECVEVAEKVLCVDKEKFMDEIREAFEFLKEIADDIGTMGMEYRSCKDGNKMRDYIRLLEDKIDELTRSKQEGAVRMKMTFDEKKEEIRKNIEELKEDIKILNKNISEFESVLDKVNSIDEMEQYKEMDIEKGLKHIELF